MKLEEFLLQTTLVYIGIFISVQAQSPFERITERLEDLNLENIFQLEGISDSQIEERLRIDNRFGRFQFDFESLAPPLDQFRPPVIPEDPLLPCKPNPRCRQRTKVYLPDGSCNNLRNPSQGQTGRAHKRLLDPAYGNARGAPRKSVTGRSLPSARRISTVMQSLDTRKSRVHTHLLVIFGQYLAHDLTDTPTTVRRRFGGGAYTGPMREINCRCGSNDPACFNIPIPRNDVQYSKNRTCFSLIRSQPVRGKSCNSNVRQQLNLITPYIDAGAVYGGSQFQFDQLLDSLSGIGKLKVGNLFPFGVSTPSAPTLPLVGHTRNTLILMSCPSNIHKPAGVPCFAAGDSRANENPALTSLHTIFVRLHNKIVTELHVLNGRWSKKKLIDTARMIVSAITQRITYKEYLPEILNRAYRKKYKLIPNESGYFFGYDENIDATISNEFAVAALRFGHTLVTSPLTRQSRSWGTQTPNMVLKNSFFDSTPLLNRGTNSVLRGLCKDPAQTVDTTFVDDLYNFLFAPSNHFGNDLLATNIQRGRDHGIPGYNAYREFCGLRRAETIDDFHEIPWVERRKLKKLYADVNDVDLYIAGLAETPVQGGLLGPTFSCILSHQFRDIKAGDRLWHENSGANEIFSPDQLQAIRRYTFSQLICDTATDTYSIQPNPFRQTNSASNRRIRCNPHSSLDLSPWLDVDSNSGSNGGGGGYREGPEEENNSGPLDFLMRVFGK